MAKEVYRYLFKPEAPADEVEGTLVLAILATACLHGESQARLDASHTFDSDRRSCAIDASTQVGRDFNRLFVGFVRREFGEDAFRVERLAESAAQPSAKSAA